LKRIPSLDGFRAISIILILICHSRYARGFPPRFTDLARHGEIGVSIFFVISGFLITTLLLIEESTNGEINLRAFYIRRAFRILPVFLLYTAFVIIWTRFENISITKVNLIHVFTFTVNFDLHRNWVLGHMWSLSVEEQFYLLGPAILIFSRKYLKPIVLCMILYTCVARVIEYKFNSYSIISLSPFFIYADAILIGVYGAIIYFERPAIIQHKAFRLVWLKLLALIIFCLFIYLSGYGKLAIIALPFGHIFISLSILFLIGCYLTPSATIIYKVLNNKAVMHIGVLSYSIYVWQQFFFVGDTRFVYLRTFPSNILIIYVVSLASYYLWEKPFLKLKRYVLQ
jgi:peptidoglycan/LPS O-acetylase OafA/YrhL